MNTLIVSGSNTPKKGDLVLTPLDHRDLEMSAIGVFRFEIGEGLKVGLSHLIKHPLWPSNHYGRLPQPNAGRQIQADAGTRDKAILHLFAGVRNTTLDALECAKGIFSLDGVNYLRQDKSIELNSSIGFRRLLQSGRHAAIRVAIFTSALPKLRLLNGGPLWRWGFGPLVPVCPVLRTPSYARHPNTFRIVRVVFIPNRSITMAKVRQAFTRPITSIPLRVFPTSAQASRHVDMLILRNEFAYFNIQQTPDGFVVGRVA